MAEAPSQTLRRTPLYDRHVAAAARMVPFAGWEMPVQYEASATSTWACGRRRASSTSRTWARSSAPAPQAGALLQRLISNDVDSLPVGGAQYAVLCREDGGILDDLVTYRLAPDRYLTVTNAANHEGDLAWFVKHADGFDAEVDRRDRPLRDDGRAGPAGARVASSRSPTRRCPPDGPPRSGCCSAARRSSAGRATPARTGSRCCCAPEDAGALWDEFVRRGATPTGLGARDTLRLEACLPLYGNDLTEERGPIEAGLGWCCKEDTGFIGSDAVRAVREAGPSERLRPLRLTGAGIPRAGNAIAGGGVVTSGTLSPCLDVGIGMGYLPADRAEVGTAIEIDVRGKTREAVVAERPLYCKERDG